LKNKIFKLLQNKKFQKKFRKFNLFLCLISIIFIFEAYRSLAYSNQYNFSLFFTPLIYLFLNYVFGILMWINYMKRNYDGASINYLSAWLLGRLTRYIPGGVSTFSTRMDQFLPKEKDHKKLFRGLIEEQFIGPILIIFTIGFLYLYGLEEIKSIEIFSIFFIVFILFRYLFLKVNGNRVTILTSPTYMFFNILTMFFFIFTLSLNFFELDPLINTIIYQFSTSISLLFVGVPAGLGIREFIYLNIETKEIQGNLVAMFALSIRYHMLFLDFMSGIFGLILRFFKK